jgi:hypothetical protein
MNSAFIPYKPTMLFLCSFSNAWSNSVSVIFVFRVWVGGGFVTYAEWSVYNRMGGENWPTSLLKPFKNVVALILFTMGTLGRNIYNKIIKFFTSFSLLLCLD